MPDGKDSRHLFGWTMDLDYFICGTISESLVLSDLVNSPGADMRDEQNIPDTL